LAFAFALLWLLHCFGFCIALVFALLRPNVTITEFLKSKKDYAGRHLGVSRSLFLA
jgi:hypothetical protein